MCRFQWKVLILNPHWKSKQNSKQLESLFQGFEKIFVSLLVAVPIKTGLGSELLRILYDACQKAYDAAAPPTCMSGKAVIVVDAVPDSTEFYKKCGYRSLPINRDKTASVKLLYPPVSDVLASFSRLKQPRHVSDTQMMVKYVKRQIAMLPWNVPCMADQFARLDMTEETVLTGAFVLVPAYEAKKASTRDGAWKRFFDQDIIKNCKKNVYLVGLVTNYLHTGDNYDVLVCIDIATVETNLENLKILVKDRYYSNHKPDLNPNPYSTPNPNPNPISCILASSFSLKTQFSHSSFLQDEKSV